MSTTNLRGILRYVPQFKDRVFVIALDGEIVESPNFSNVLLDLAVLRSLGLKLVLVHGASYQIRALARERGVITTNLYGDGVTDAQTLDLALDAATRLNNDILRGLTSVDLSGAYANALIAGPLGIIGGVDHLHTGKILRTDTRLLETFLGEGIIPVLPPLGFDGEGATFRVNSDAVAVRVAEDLGAIKILYLCACDGVVYDGVPQRQVSDLQVRQMLKHRHLITPPSIRSKMEFAEDACRSGIPRVHILDGQVNQALLTELFSNEGVGTMVYSDEYKRIRPAARKDLRRLLSLMQEAGAPPEEVDAQRQLIPRFTERYSVYEIDGNPVAVLGIRTFPAEGLAEIDTLFIDKAHVERGYARRLLWQAEETCRKQGITRFVVLNPALHNYFRNVEGFATGSVQDVPDSRSGAFATDGQIRRLLVKRIDLPEVLEDEGDAYMPPVPPAPQAT